MEYPLHDGKERLTPFEVLLRELDAQKDRAAEKYEELRFKLVKFFEWSSCFASEDLADEVLDRVGRILQDHPVFDLEPFLWGVAKNIRQENHRRTERIVAITGLPDQGISLRDKCDVEAEVHAIRQDEVQLKCLHLCLDRLNDHSRRVFLRYHGLFGDTGEGRSKLASELGLTIGALRVRINRIRNQLKKCVQQCLAFSPQARKPPAK